MTVLYFERHPVHPNCVGSFEALAADFVAEARRASGVLWADVFRASDDDPSFLVLSEWRTEADLRGWLSGQPAATFAQSADVLWREEPTRRRFMSAPQGVAVGSPED